MSDPLPTFVFQDVSADLFQHGNPHVLVYADRLSGWPVVHQWRRDPTAREVIQAVVHNFVELGVPMRFRSDNGPQFDAGVFQETLKRWGVAWGNSTPHYPQSNSHAEAAVKAMKELVAKTGDLSSEEFLAGLLEFRNTPHESGASPAQILFGHQLRSIIPAHRSSYAPKWKDVMMARERQAAAAAETKLRYDVHTGPLSPLRIGTQVRIQDPDSKLWIHVGVIVAVGRYRSYRVKFASGSVLWRNRRFLRPLIPVEEEPTATIDQTDPSADGSAPTVGDVIVPPESTQQPPCNLSHVVQPFQSNYLYPYDMHLSPICPEVSVKFCSPLAVFTGSPLYLFVLFVRNERGLGRSCDVSKVVTDGAQKAYARGPWSERHSSQESSGRRSYCSVLCILIACRPRIQC